MSRATSVIAALLLTADGAAAQPAEPFFARKTVSISIGYTAGGSYDLYGRLVARHLGKHLPGQPAVVAQNMPGAGSLKAANWLYEVAPRDGTALGVIVELAALEQALANSGVQFDAAKFVYIGSRRHQQQHLHAVACGEGAVAGGCPAPRDDDRRHWSGLDRRDRPAAAQRADRHQVQAGQRLSRIERGHAGDGTRRGRGRLLVVGGGQGRQAGLAARTEDQDHSADRATTRRRAAVRAEPRRDRQHCRGQAGACALRQRQLQSGARCLPRPASRRIARRRCATPSRRWSRIRSSSATSAGSTWSSTRFPASVWPSSSPKRSTSPSPYASGPSALSGGSSGGLASRDDTRAIITLPL